MAAADPGDGRASEALLQQCASRRRRLGGWNGMDGCRRAVVLEQLCQRVLDMGKGWAGRRGTDMWQRRRHCAMHGGGEPSGCANANDVWR